MFFLFISFFFTFNCVFSETFAILESGIGEWKRLAYSSEASIYHTYFDMLNGGIPKENIVVMSINNVAYNPSNPKPGYIAFTDDNINVWPTVSQSIDYEGKDVNSTNLYKLMLGESMEGVGSERSPLSRITENDDVIFVTMNHGALGHVVFDYPVNETEENNLYYDMMWAVDVVDTIKRMKFRNLVWFMCSCYSGSMFNTAFSSSDNVFIVTAAPVDRSALACGYSSELGTCTSCCFHENWLRFIRLNAGILDQKTLMEQYAYSYLQKSNYGLNIVEEYCYYGSEKVGSSVTVAEIEGNFVNPPKTNSHHPHPQQQQETEPFKTVLKMSDFSPLRELGRKNKNENKKKKDELVGHDGPFPSFIQFNYTSFDSDYLACNPTPTTDLQCIKEFFLSCLSDTNITSYCYTDQAMDSVRIGCSEGAKTTPEILIKMLKQSLNS